MRIVFSTPLAPLLFMPDAQNQEDWFAVKKTLPKARRKSAKTRKKLQPPAQPAVQQIALPFQADGHTLAAVHQVADPQAPAANHASLVASSRLRVVREFDSAISPSCAGRMVISGRMADVCAELERMSHA